MANLKLIASVSKRLPEATGNDSITELEMCGFCYKHCEFYLSPEKGRFNVIVDHLALTHIIKSKAEPTTTRIKRILEVFKFLLI